MRKYVKFYTAFVLCLMLICFTGIYSGASDTDATPTPETTPEADASPTPETTPEADASPTPETTPETDASPTPETTPDPDASPTPETTPDPDASPTPETTPDPDATPTPETTPDPDASPTPETTPDPDATPTPETTPDPDASPTPDATVTSTPTPDPGTTVTSTPTPTTAATPTPSPVPDSGRAITRASLSDTSLDMRTDESFTLYLNVSPYDASYDVEWSTSSSSIVSLSSKREDSVVLRARREGSATITAHIEDDNGSSRTLTCRVYVDDDSSRRSLSATAYMGANLTMSGLADDLDDEYRDMYNRSISDSAEIVFSSISGTSYGTLYLTNGSAIRSGYDYTFPQFRLMYFKPSAAGTWSASYELSYGSRVISGTISISVRSESISSGAGAVIRLNQFVPYLFSSSDTISSSSGAELLNAAVSASYGSSGWHHIRFNPGSISAASSQTGTLYLNSSMTPLSSSADISYQDLGSLYFVPSQTGSYAISFYIYNANSVIAASGSLQIITPVQTVNRAINAPYTFTIADFPNLNNSSVTSVIFDLPAYGTLFTNYADGTGNALAANVRCAVSNASYGALSVTQVTYVPSGFFGYVTLFYTAYTQSGFYARGSFLFHITRNASDIFTDIPARSYYESAVLWALNNGVTTGTSPTTFEPAATCTRGQAATFLWRAKGSPTPRTTQNPFTDVSPNSAFYRAILWAYENGITSGASPTTFNPSGTCTYAHVLTFIWRAEGSPIPSVPTALSQRYSAAYYSNALAWADAEGLLAGTTLAFSPNLLCPRADVVTFLYRNASE